MRCCPPELGGAVPEGAANGSTILDCSTDGVVRIVRQGVLPREAVAEALGDLLAG